MRTTSRLLTIVSVHAHEMQLKKRNNRLKTIDQTRYGISEHCPLRVINLYGIPCTLCRATRCRATRCRGATIDEMLGATINEMLGATIDEMLCSRRRSRREMLGATIDALSGYALSSYTLSGYTLSGYALSTSVAGLPRINLWSLSASYCTTVQ